MRITGAGTLQIGFNPSPHEVGHKVLLMDTQKPVLRQAIQSTVGEHSRAVELEKDEEGQGESRREGTLVVMICPG